MVFSTTKTAYPVGNYPHKTMLLCGPFHQLSICLAFIGCDILSFVRSHTRMYKSIWIGRAVLLNVCQYAGEHVFRAAVRSLMENRLSSLANAMSLQRNHLVFELSNNHIKHHSALFLRIFSLSLHLTFYHGKSG